MKITGLGSVLIGTDNEVDGSIVNVVGSNVMVNNATFTGKEGGLVEVGYNAGVPKTLLTVNFNGAIANSEGNYGLNGQALSR